METVHVVGKVPNVIDNLIIESKNQRNGKLGGDFIWNCMIEVLEYFDNIDPNERRTPDQKRMHYNFLIATLSIIYKYEYDARLTELKQKFNLEFIARRICVSAPRRVGKTHTIVLFIVAWLLSVPNELTSLYSTGTKAGKRMIKSVCCEILY